MSEKENDTLSTKLKKNADLVGSIIVIAGGIIGIIGNPKGPGILWIVFALFGLGGLSYLVYKAIKRAKQKRHTIQDRSTGFNEALAYTKNDAHRFYGRQNDTFNILNRIDREDYHLGVLHGESGVGKTSIIQAGLIPELEKRNLQWGYVSLNHLPKTIDSADDLVDFLLSRVGKKFNLSGAANLKEMANQLAAASKTGTVLFLDQFEQIFDRTHEEARQEFSQRLEECCRSADLLKLVIVVRGDYFGRVFKMFQDVERSAISDLAKFNKNQAREVIRKSAGYDENLHITSPDDPLLDFEGDILNDLQDSDGRIHPVELSLICSTIMKQNGKLDRDAYLDGGRKQGWLIRYLDDVLKGQPQQASLQLLSGLIDVDKAATLTAKEISERSGLNLPETQGLLNYFQQSRLIVEEGENDQQKYRLAHEYLIASIRLRCGDVETPVQKYNRLLESRVQTWEREDYNPLHLLKGKSLYKVRFQLKEHLGWEASPVKRAFIRKSLMRYLAVMLGYLFTLTVLVGLIGYGWHSLNENARVTKYLTALKYKNGYELENIETELVELSREDIEVKMKVLEDVLSETRRCYKNEIMPVLCQTLIGLSTENRDKVVEFMIDRLGNSNMPHVQSLTAKALGEIGNEKAVEPLIILLENSKDTDILSLTAGALGKIGNEKAVDPLIKFLENSTNSDAQISVAWALGRIGNNKAVDPLIKLIKNSMDLPVQVNALIVLGQIGNEKAVDPLIEILENSKNSSLQSNAAWVLGEIKSKKAVDPVIEILKNSKDSSVQSSAARALGKIGNAKAVDPLIKLLDNSTDSAVQCSVAGALGKIRNERAVDPLIKLLEKTTNSSVQISAAGVLGAIGNAKAIELLITLLENSKDSFVQHDAAAALGEIGNEKVVEPLIKLLEKSKDRHVLSSAAWALGKIENEKAVEPLITLLKNSTDPNVQVSAAGALGEIGPPAKSALSKLNRLFEKENDYMTRYDLARAMLKIEPTNRKYLTIMFEELLPHPFNALHNYIGTGFMDLDILKSIGAVAGKEAAGENLDFGGDMWKMLEWWEKFKEK